MNFRKDVCFLAGVTALLLALGWSAPVQAKATRQAKATTSKTVQAAKAPVARFVKSPAKSSAKTSVRAAAKPSGKAVASSARSSASAAVNRKGRVRQAGAGAMPLAQARVEAPVQAQMPLMPISVKTPAGVPLKPSATVAAASGATGASFGQIYGLHHTSDPLDLKSSVALVMDQETNEVVLAKNSEAVLPIASLTKLMTAAVIVDARLPMDEDITVTSDDVDTEKNSSSRLTVGATLTRGELLHLALMSSENRAAHALGRTYPGGLQAFVSVMNAKAKLLGMQDTRYVDPTGLNSNNQSSARDLAVLVKAAYQQPLIRELSTSPEHAVRLGNRQVQFRNTNSLVRSPAWDIGLQKTGYIVEAGRCLVMQASMVGRKYIMIFLDSTGKYSRQADAERVRRWLERAPHKTSSTTTTVVPGAVKVTS
ncbi:D-alanyl-D-alanine endopeptidase [Aquabacterium sp.]|uniref:D-alanyl-D-alanine endopeptidase n=1 Tax=Aquabacterium sp. TaxID=1872578 RepID=UPI00248A4A56|nr:D-alanyl-D-alanine endopeptidase [Aquabacterium sp.]MDI1349150.1 D-alanyl-D-alanine endopeptidase [Aquabacterium sp.]